MSVTAPVKENPYKRGMTSQEADNFDTLKASPKKFSDDEARDMATNPSKRLPPITKIPFADKAQRRYGGEK